MTHYDNLEDALKAPSSARSLKIDCRDLNALPDEIGELSELTSLTLKGVHDGLVVPSSASQLSRLTTLSLTGVEDCSASVPEAFLELPVTDLELRHFRIGDVVDLAGQLERLRLSSHYIFEDIRPLCERFVALEHLAVWAFFARNSAGDKDQLHLPESVANLENLAGLEIVSAGMTELPDELGQLERLTTIRLRNHDFETFPLALTRVPNLVELEFAQMKQLDRFPDEMRAMTSLRRLDVGGSWNGGDLPDSWSDREYEPLPAVFGSLESLHSLTLDYCALPGLEPLAPLSNLLELSVDWGAFDDVEPLSKLTSLESLSLQHSWVEDLSPLADLPNLRSLNLSNSKVSDLGPLAALNNLEHLNIESSAADDDPARALEPLAKLPGLDVVVSWELAPEDWVQLRQQDPVDTEGLLDQLASDDLDDVSSAIQTIIDYSEARSTHKMNALLGLFGLDEALFHSDEVVAFEPLDQALERWASKLEPMDLAGLAAATFVSNYDGWRATLIALEELTRRDDLDAQLAFVEAWFEATTYYDGGHRPWSQSVHDRLVDDIWERFDARALATLLVDTSGDQLDSMYGDAMDELFVPALAGLEDYDEALMERVRKYAFRNIDDAYGASPSETLELLEEAADGAIEPIASELRAITAQMREEMAASK